MSGKSWKVTGMRGIYSLTPADRAQRYRNKKAGKPAGVTPRAAHAAWIRKIAAEANVSVRTIHRRLDEANRDAFAKREEIRKLAAEGLGAAEIARRIEIPAWAISRIISLLEAGL